MYILLSKNFIMFYAFYSGMNKFVWIKIMLLNQANTMNTVAIRVLLGFDRLILNTEKINIYLRAQLRGGICDRFVSWYMTGITIYYKMIEITKTSLKFAFSNFLNKPLFGLFLHAGR